MKRLLFLFVFILFSCSKNNFTNNLDNKTVGIIPYEEISNEEVVVLSKAIEDFYGIKTIVLPQKKMPTTAFVNIKSPRYRADSIIKFQNRNCPDSLDFVLGLTVKDVSVTKKDKGGNILKPKWKYNDFGVMGLAYCPGKSSIISKFRLRSSNKKLELERFKKVVIHEFGHNLGLPHCPDKNCVMTSAAEKISTIDKEKMELCDVCKRQII